MIDKIDMIIAIVLSCLVFIFYTNSTMPQRKNVKSSGSSAGLMCDFFRILLLTWKL